MLITLRSKGVKSEFRRNLLKPNPNLSQRPIMKMKQNHGLPIIHLALKFFARKVFIDYRQIESLSSYKKACIKLFPF